VKDVHGKKLKTPDANNRFSGLKKFQEHVLANRSNPITIMDVAVLHSSDFMTEYNKIVA